MLLKFSEVACHHMVPFVMLKPKCCIVFNMNDYMNDWYQKGWGVNSIFSCEDLLVSYITPWNGIFSFVSRKATFKQQNVLLFILSFVMPQKKFNLDIIQFKWIITEMGDIEIKSNRETRETFLQMASFFCLLWRVVSHV